MFSFWGKKDEALIHKGACAGGSTAQPDWLQVETEHNYFCRALADLFAANGYRVLAAHPHQGQGEPEARECGYLLQRDDKLVLGLGLRQVLVVTSDVVGRLGRALLSARADSGLLLTTSSFTMAALRAAQDWQIELYDRQQLRKLLNGR